MCNRCSELKIRSESRITTAVLVYRTLPFYLEVIDMLLTAFHIFPTHGWGDSCQGQQRGWPTRTPFAAKMYRGLTPFPAAELSVQTSNWAQV